jgi:hypothetical protein
MDRNRTQCPTTNPFSHILTKPNIIANMNTSSSDFSNHSRAELCMGRPWVTHLKIGNPWDPMGDYWVNCKYSF